MVQAFWAANSEERPASFLFNFTCEAPSIVSLNFTCEAPASFLLILQAKASIVSLNFTGNVPSIDHLIVNFHRRATSNDLGREVRI